MVRLRAERARLLGYETFAHFKLADTMAKTPDAALGLLECGLDARRVAARKDERDDLQAIVAGEGGNFKIAPWDWRYYAERRRKAEFDFDEASSSPISSSTGSIEAAFDTAQPPVRPAASRSCTISSSIIPTFAPGSVIGRDGAPCRRCSSATISRGRQSAAAPG